MGSWNARPDLCPPCKTGLATLAWQTWMQVFCGQASSKRTHTEGRGRGGFTSWQVIPSLGSREEPESSSMLFHFGGVTLKFSSFCGKAENNYGPQPPPSHHTHTHTNFFYPSLPPRIFIFYCPTKHLIIYFFFFSFIFISWRLITLQYCSGFCHTLTWISHGFTCIPHPDPPSHRPLHPLPPGPPRAPGPSACLMHPTWAGDLFHPR